MGEGEETPSGKNDLILSSVVFYPACLPGNFLCGVRIQQGYLKAPSGKLVTPLSATFHRKTSEVTFQRLSSWRLLLLSWWLL